MCGLVKEKSIKEEESWLSKNEKKEVIEFKLAPPPEPKHKKKSPEPERKTEIEEKGEE